MSFRLLGLDPGPFLGLYGLPEPELRERGVRRHVVDATPGFPDRIEVRDAGPGETVLLMNYVHQPADTPYRASHAIFVREFAETRCDLVDAIPEAVRVRPISLRAFNDAHEMVDADLVDCARLEDLIHRQLANPEVAYLHAHYARRGCYAARIERA
jgi:hypothetical protein